MLQLSILYADVKIENLSNADFQELTTALSNWNIPEITGARIFQVRDVLIYQQADCLGYAKLLTCLGNKFAFL